MSEHEHGALHSSAGPPKESADDTSGLDRAGDADRRRRLRLPRLLHLWARLTRGLTLGVRAAVIDARGHILLVRHTYVAGWHLPGGGVEPGETAEQALGRELVEEAAIRLTAPPRLHGLFLNTHLGARDHVAVYVAAGFEAGPPPAPNREIAEIGFFPPDALPAATTPATRRRIAEITAGRPPDACW